MYRCGNNTCGKRRKSETACTDAESVPAEREGRVKPHVTLRELYVRKLPGAGKSMYHCGNCTCGKRRESETACNIAGTVHAETAGNEKAHVQIQRVYLQKRWSGRMGMYVAQEWKFVRGRRSGN